MSMNAKPLVFIRKDEHETISSLWKVNKAILESLDFGEVTNKVVNVILDELDYMKVGYRISVLTLLDSEKKVIRRVSFSPTKDALKILKKANVEFKDLNIPLSVRDNVLVKVVKQKKAYVTYDLSDVFYPNLDRNVWRRLQKMVGIKMSLIFPLIIRGDSIGAMIFSLAKTEKEISTSEKAILGGFTDSVAVALENAKLYENLHEANQKLKELDKRKDEFLSVAAHELRAPLTAVKGYLSMVMDGDVGKLSDSIKQMLQGALTGAEREVRLVNNMLNVSRIEENRLVYKMGKVKLSEIVKTVAMEFRLQAEEKGLKFAVEIDKKIKDLVEVDEDRIHEVVANFVSNAVKYTDQGSVTLKLSNPSGKAVRFESVDTGYGMTKEEQSKLFQKFYRAESSAGKVLGTGLGLYTTKLLVQKFGGDLGLTSEKGAGSTFWFELPAVS